MTNAEFHLLSDVYKLLGQYDARTITIVAEQENLSKNLQSALKALAREARRNETKSSHKTRPSERESTRSPTRPVSTSDYRSQMYEFFNDPRKFPDKVSLVTFLDHFKLPIPVDSKVSKKVLIRKTVTRALSDLSFRKKLDTATKPNGDDQTQGWLKVISRPRRSIPK